MKSRASEAGGCVVQAIVPIITPSFCFQSMRCHCSLLHTQDTVSAPVKNEVFFHVTFHLSRLDTSLMSSNLDVAGKYVTIK